ncbi:hypothetical protein HPB50_029033 [Hyalomma asiaticum]|nr:hypothetical protein HPB50_029033 [Hyalomma asiaticum]
MKFGHASAACKDTISSSRFGEPHASDSCAATSLKYRSDLECHDVSSKDSPNVKKKIEILKGMARCSSSRLEAHYACVLRLWSRRLTDRHA